MTKKLVETYKHIQGVHIICVNFSAVYHNSKKKKILIICNITIIKISGKFLLYFILFILFTVSTNYHKFKYINKSYYLFL